MLVKIWSCQHCFFTLNLLLIIFSIHYHVKSFKSISFLNASCNDIPLVGPAANRCMTSCETNGSSSSRIVSKHHLTNFSFIHPCCCKT